MASANEKQFRPPLWGTIGLVVGCAICGTAGFWQLDRAEEKRALFAAFERNDGEMLREPVADRDVERYLYRRMTLSGRYAPEHQILLDNMTHEGRPGYQVLTPLMTGNGAVLVNRGWLRADPDRNSIPDVAVTDNIRTVTGRLYRLPRAGYKLEPVAPLPDTPWPRRLSFPSVEEIVEQVGFRTHDYQLLLDPIAADGYLREWRPALMRPEKHTAYAIQWFLMALTLTIIYSVLTLRSARRISSNV